MSIHEITTMAQAIFCGGLCYVIAFKYQRRGASYKFWASLCAAGLASLFGQQWLSIVGRILFYGEWPIVSPYNTLVYAILFLLAIRAKGNVTRMFEVPGSSR